MNTLIFHNPGEIDIRGACIAGLSAKESKSPIGYFGTGLKYSIACILRWGGEIIIYSGERHYSFHTERMNFRGQEFQHIVMRDHGPEFKDTGYGFQEQPIGFTTEYGKNWQPWQVFRELYANARDEGGTVHMGTHPSMIGGGYTHIFVNCPELIEPFYSRDKIILPSNTIWDQQSNEIQFSEAPANGLYYRGVRVHDQAAYFTWNFLSETKLTEDRTLTSVISWSSRFDHFIEQNLHDTEIIMKLFEMKYGKEELTLSRVVERDGKPHTLNEKPVEAVLMDWYTMPVGECSWHSKEYKQALMNLYQRDPMSFSKLRSYVRSIDEKFIEEKLYAMSPREQQMFDKAKELVALFGFEDEINRLPIHVQDLGGNTLGCYEHGTIYLSPKLFDQGTKQLVATLYEECYHHRTQNKDCTYDMQTDLFNIIISLNEELHKVIC